MATLVDTNVLVDLAVRDPDWRDWSLAQLLAAGRRGSVVINQIIYSEFSFRYDKPEEVEALLPEPEFMREGLPWSAAFAAAQAFRVYRANGGRRDKVLPDFLIGAHAVVRGHTILTRDPAGYRAYFPTVELICPETHP